MNYKISSFIIGIIFISLVIAAFTIFMGEMNTGYTRTDYNSSEYTTLNKMSDMSDIAGEMRNNTNVDKDASLFDVIGAYFTSGYSAVRVAAGSVETFTEMGGTAASKTGIPYIDLIWNALLLIVLIIIFIGILLSLLVKDKI